MLNLNLVVVCLHEGFVTKSKQNCVISLCTIWHFLKHATILKTKKPLQIPSLKKMRELSKKKFILCYCLIYAVQFVERLYLFCLGHSWLRFPLSVVHPHFCKHTDSWTDAFSPLCLFKCLILFVFSPLCLSNVRFYLFFLHCVF